MFNDVIDDASLELTSATTVGFETDSALSQLRERHVDPQDLSDPANPSDEDRDIDLQWVFDQTSTADDNSVGVGGEDPSSAQAPCVEFTELKELQQSMTESVADARTTDIRDDPIEVEDDDQEKSTSTSVSPSSSSSGCDETSQNSDEVANHLKRSGASKAALNNSDSIDKDKAADLLRALGDRSQLAEILGRLDEGALAEALGSLGYEKPKEAEAKAMPCSSSGFSFDTNMNEFTCSKPGCSKAFGRQCELR